MEIDTNIISDEEFLREIFDKEKETKTNHASTDIEDELTSELKEDIINSDDINKKKDPTEETDKKEAEADNNENLDEEIENLLLQNKLYSDIDVRTTNEIDYNAIIVNRSDYKLLKKCIPIFTDEILRQNLTFKALDVLIEDVVNKKIIGYIRGDF